MQEYGRHLALPEFFEAHDFVPAAFFSCGPDMEDFDHILSIRNAGYFKTSHSLLILNENLVPQGRTALGAFQAITQRKEYLAMMGEGVRPVLMPQLACMGEVRRSGLSLLDAACGLAGIDGRPLDPLRQFMVRQFLTKILNELDLGDALSWLP